MASQAELAERQGRMLAELGELGLSLARELHSRAMAAETPQETAELAEAFNRISRSVRHSLALQAKLQREAARDLREFTARERQERRAQLKTRLTRMIRGEVVERDVARQMIYDSPEFIEQEAESERFLDEPIETQLARIRKAMGVDDYWVWEDEDAEGADAAEGAADEVPAESEPAEAEPAAPVPPSRPPWASPHDDEFDTA